MRRVSTIVTLVLLFVVCATPAPTGFGALTESVERALEDGDARKAITVSLQVSGGPPVEAYTLDFQVLGGGTVRYKYADALSEGEKHIGEALLQNGALSALLEEILDSGVLRVAAAEAGFVPNTVVGKLEITDGVTVFCAYFAADEAQAAAQGRLPPPELKATVEALYDLAAEVIGVQSIKP